MNPSPATSGQESSAVVWQFEENRWFGSSYNRSLPPGGLLGGHVRGGGRTGKLLYILETLPGGMEQPVGPPVNAGGLSAELWLPSGRSRARARVRATRSDPVDPCPARRQPTFVKGKPFETGRVHWALPVAAKSAAQVLNGLRPPRANPSKLQVSRN